MWWVIARTKKFTHTQTQALTIPEGQYWPQVKIIGHKMICADTTSSGVNFLPKYYTPNKDIHATLVYFFQNVHFKKLFEKAYLGYIFCCHSAVHFNIGKKRSSIGIAKSQTIRQFNSIKKNYCHNVYIDDIQIRFLTGKYSVIHQQQGIYQHIMTKGARNPSGFMGAKSETLLHLK